MMKKRHVSVSSEAQHNIAVRASTMTGGPMDGLSMVVDTLWSQGRPPSLQLVLPITLSPLALAGNVDVATLERVNLARLRLDG